MTLAEILNLFSELKENNNREWYKSQEQRFKDAKNSFELFTEMMINEVRGFDPSVGDLDAKKCVFRLFRDVRFSKNKDPYKTHFGAFIANGGRKSPYAGYYIHLEPGNSFIGGGIYMPQPKILKAIRKRIFDDPEEFKKIIDNQEFKQYYPEIMGDKLKTAPQGYSKDFEHIDLLNHKHYAVGHQLKDNIWSDPEAIQKITHIFKVQFSLNQYLNECAEDQL